MLLWCWWGRNFDINNLHQSPATFYLNINWRVFCFKEVLCTQNEAFNYILIVRLIHNDQKISHIAAISLDCDVLFYDIEVYKIQCVLEYGREFKLSLVFHLSYVLLMTSI